MLEHRIGDKCCMRRAVGEKCSEIDQPWRTVCGSMQSEVGSWAKEKSMWVFGRRIQWRRPVEKSEGAEEE